MTCRTLLNVCTTYPSEEKQAQLVVVPFLDRKKFRNEYVSAKYFSSHLGDFYYSKCWRKGHLFYEEPFPIEFFSPIMPLEKSYWQSHKNTKYYRFCILRELEILVNLRTQLCAWGIQGGGGRYMLKRLKNAKTTPSRTAV